MTVLTNMTYDNRAIRTLEIDGVQWWVARDICSVIGLQNVSQAVSYLDDDERAIITNDTRFDNQETIIISESGLYSLILRSRKPEAKTFKRWITHEVLPSIRKYGMYATPATIDELRNNPDALAATLNALKAEQAKRIAAEQELEAVRPKAVFSDVVAGLQSSILIHQLAKILWQRGVEIGSHGLFEFLRENGYLCKHGRQRNTPTKQAIAAGLLEVKLTPITRNGNMTVQQTPLVTVEGQTHFVNLFLHGKRTTERRAVESAGNPSTMLLQRRPRLQQKHEVIPCETQKELF